MTCRTSNSTYQKNLQKGCYTSRPIGHTIKSLINSTVGRIFIGIAVAIACFIIAPETLGILGSAAIGGATTTGLGLATGNGILKSLGEGFLTATIFGGIGKIAESYKSAHDPGPINVPTPNNDKPMQQEPGGGGRAPQGDDFADPASHKSFENASPSGNAYNYLNVFPSMMSDRSGNGSFVGGTYASLFGDNSYNGAKSKAHKEMYSLGHLGAETMQQYRCKTNSMSLIKPALSGP